MKTLVIYFSMTGTTAKIAREIAAELDCDIYEIRAAEKYTAEDLDWTRPNCRANQEQSDKSSRPAYAGELPDISPYEQIIVGYPLWWGVAPRIVYTVLEDLDLAGKKLTAFATSGSSSFDKAQKEMEDLLKIKLLHGSRLESQADISKWLQANGLKPANQ